MERGIRGWKGEWGGEIF